MLKRIAKLISDWWNRRNTPKPPSTPAPDPDPILPAKVLSFQWGKDPQQTATIYVPARRW